MKARTTLAIVAFFNMATSVYAYELMPWEKDQKYAPTIQSVGTQSFEPPSECPEIGQGADLMAAVRDCFDHNGAKLNHLYQLELRKNPQLEGALNLTISTGPTGEVTAVQVLKSELSPSFTEILTKYIKGLKFGSPVAGKTFNYSIHLFPN